MLNAKLLTWDNMEEVIEALPRDENGRFFPNPRVNEKLVLSTTRDNWVEEPIDLLSPISKTRKNLITNPVDIILNATEAKTGVVADDFKSKIIDVLIDDGFLYDKERWVNVTTFGYVDDLLVLKTDSGVLVDIREEPISASDESVVKLNDTKFYVVCRIRESKPEPVTVATPKHLALSIDKEQAELNNDPLLRAQRSLANLDTTEAEKEFASSATNMERAKEIRKSGLLEVVDSPLNRPDMTPEQLAVWREEQAKKIIGKMDGEFVVKGRLNVNDKTLMNSKTDLNQLIPFKYPWSWSIYLTSCERHWMPGETALYRCIDDWKNLSDSFKLLLARAHLTHLSRKQLFPEHVLLNMYRMLENPECRQYLLRQGMESVTIYHAWMEIDELLGVKNTLIGGLKPSKALAEDNYTFISRGAITMKHIGFMHNFESTTDSPEDLASFVKAFIIMYTHTNFLMPLISHYQMITALEYNETCQPLAQMFQYLNRDSISQFNFAKLFVSGVLDENPDLFKQEWFEDIATALEALMYCEFELIRTLKAGETDSIDVEYICKHFIDDMLAVVSPHYTKMTLPTGATRGMEFVQIIESLAPKVDLNAGLGGVSW